MKRHNVRTLWLLLSCALLVAGCGSIDHGNLTASRLVTKADAERVLGVPVRLQTDTTSERESTCLYVGDAGNEGMSLQLTVTVGQSEEQVKEVDAAAERFLSEKGELKLSVKVDGIGDRAWLEQTEGSQTLHVRKKNFAFLIIAHKGVYKEPSYDEMKRLANRVADKL